MAPLELAWRLPRSWVRHCYSAAALHSYMLSSGTGLQLSILSQAMVSMHAGLHGAKVAVTGRRQAVLDAASTVLQKQGITVLGLQGDVRQQESCERWVSQVGCVQIVFYPPLCLCPCLCPINPVIFTPSKDKETHETPQKRPRHTDIDALSEIVLQLWHVGSALGWPSLASWCVLSERMRVL